MKESGKNQLVLLVVFSSVAVFSCQRTESHRPPWRGYVDENYFRCDKSRSLQGGISEKGPLRSFGPDPASCNTSEWMGISKNQFKQLATEWYGIDWTKDIPFFEYDQEEAL